MSIRRLDTIGLTKFILYVPLTLAVCFGLLKINTFIEYIKVLIGYSPKYFVYYSILLVTILLIFIALLLYVDGINRLQSAYALGQRMQEECKNIYSIYNTANYQLHLTVTDPSATSPINTMNIACILLYIVVGLVFSSLLLNNHYIWNSIRDKIPETDRFLPHALLYGYPITGILMALSTILTLIISINSPSYLKTTAIPLSLTGVYILVLVCFIITIKKYKEYIEPYGILLMAVAFLSILLIYFIQTNRIENSITTDYRNLTDLNGKNPYPTGLTIAKDLNAIATADDNFNAKAGKKSLGANLTKYSDLPNPPTTPFTKHLMENIKATPEWANKRPPADHPLWPYVLNEANGKELDNMFLTDTSTEKTLQTHIKQFRKDMSVLRSLETPGKALSDLAFKANLVILFLVVTTLYPLFNIMYKNNPTLITYIVSIGMIFVLCLCCLIGFVSKFM